MSDEVLTAMADELRKVLVSMGLDPKDPPMNGPPPIDRTLAEYRRRGGDPALDGPTVVQRLIEEVSAGA
jgi:hypothetical protein